MTVECAPDGGGIGVEPAVHRRSITNRERAVLRLIAYGHTNEYIAAELGITIDTVKTHKWRIVARLGARDRAHAVTIALQTGELKLPGIGGAGTPDAPHRLASLVGRDAKLTLINGMVLIAAIVAVDADGVDVVARTIAKPARRYTHREIHRIEPV